MRVFLSYSDLDRAVAVRLHEGLRHRRPDLDLYLAPVRNRLGAYWIPRLAEELAAADAVLLLMGDRVGTWQELEYAEAVRLNRNTRRPLIAPILLGDAVPGLPFIDQFHRLVFDPSVFDHVLDGILAALDGSVAPDAAPLWRLTNPYRGLPAMRSEDAAYFFGREAITAEILDTLRLKPDRIIALVGNSGVGKSSIAQAGVLAALRSRLWPGDPDRAWPAALADSPAWLPVTIIPGERPLKALALGFARTWLDDPADAEAQAIKWVDLLAAASDLAALADAARSQVAERTAADPPPRVLLYVDQAEELYARAEPGEAEAVSRLLADAVRRPEILVLSSLRSDYYGRFQNDGPLFAASDRLDVPPLGREQIDRVIRGPAARLGVRFDRPEIVPLIAQATARAPGSMPMLSYLMADAWEAMRRDQASGGVLSFAYEIVDISRPLADRADRFLDQHPDSEVALRRLFTLKLTHMPKEGEPVRRRAGRQDCTAEEWSLAEQLAGPDWRLLSTGQEGGEAVVEVAHEALLRNWPRLVLWLDSAREFLIWKGQLEADRREWEAATDADKPRALLTGLRLDAARFWLAERGVDLGEVDRAFVRASQDADDQRQVEEAERERRRQEAELEVARHAQLAAETQAKAEAEAAMSSRRVARRTLVGAIMAIVLAIAAIGLALVGESERRRAEDELRRAQVERARYHASVAMNMATEGYASAAVEVALTAMQQLDPRYWGDLAEVSELPDALYYALSHRRTVTILRVAPAPLADGDEVLLPEEEARRFLAASVQSALFSPDGTRVLTLNGLTSVRLWDAATGVQLAHFGGHERGVSSVAFSPDGTLVATASYDGTARVWNAATGAEVGTMRGHGNAVNSVAFSPDGMTLVTASTDRTARFWDVATEAEIGILSGHEDIVDAAVFSPNGRRVMTFSLDGTTRLWDARTGRETAQFQGVDAAFSRDSVRLITVEEDVAFVWLAGSHAQIAALRGHGAWITSAAFSPDARRVVTGSRDNTARIWDALYGYGIAVLRGHESAVTSVAFSPDGSRVATGSNDATVRLWDAITGNAIAVLRGHEETVRSVVFSPDGSQVLSAGLDGTVRVWNAVDGVETTVLRGHEQPVRRARYSPDGMRIVTASWDRTARLWDAGDAAEIATLQHGGRINSVEFSPDGSLVLTASDDQTARLWDAVSGRRVRVLGGHEHDVVSAVFSPDGTKIMTASVDNTARLWDVASGDEIAVLHGQRDGMFAPQFSPDGTRGAISHDGVVEVWDATTGATIVTLRADADRVRTSAFSPDGLRIATGSQDGVARLWDTTSGAEIAELSHLRGAVSTSAFSSDGARFLTVSDDDVVRLWDVETGTETAALRGHEDRVWHPTFSPDGALVLTASQDGTARLWDTHTGAAIFTLRGHEGPVNFAAFAPNGREVVTASDDHTVRLWPIYPTVDDLMNHAQEVVDHLQPLTDTERCAYYLTAEGCDR